MANSSILNSFKKVKGHNGNNAAIRFFVIPKKDKSPEALVHKKATVEAWTSNNSERDPFRDIPLKEKVNRNFKAQRSDMSSKVIPGNSFARKKAGNARLALPSPRQSIQSTAYLFSPFSREIGWGVA